MPYSPEYLELWTSLAFENNDKKRLYSYQSFQGRDRKRQTDELFWRNSNELGLDLTGLGFILDNATLLLALPKQFDIRTVKDAFRKQYAKHVSQMCKFIRISYTAYNKAAVAELALEEE